MKSRTPYGGKPLTVWMPLMRPIVPAIRIVEEWQFPLGDNVATLKIVGRENVVPEDIDALIALGHMFKKSIVRRQPKPEPEYYI